MSLDREARKAAERDDAYDDRKLLRGAVKKKNGNPRRDHDSRMQESSVMPQDGISKPDKQFMDETMIVRCFECDRAAGRHSPRCSQA